MHNRARQLLDRRIQTIVSKRSSSKHHRHRAPTDRFRSVDDPPIDAQVSKVLGVEFGFGLDLDTAARTLGEDDLYSGRLGGVHELLGNLRS
jgi:hypothetical protein